MTASPGLQLVVVALVGADESDSERLCASSARMVSAMALPSMILPRGVAACAAAWASVDDDADADDMANGIVVVVAMMTQLGDGVGMILMRRW